MDQNLLLYLDFAATFTFAVSGAIKATQKNLDWFGALFIAFVTAAGGGTLRDLMIGDLPVFWLGDYVSLVAVISAVVVTLLFYSRINKLGRMFLFFDAIGIGVACYIGMEKALAKEITAAAAITMGMFTAVLGGMLRDVICGEIPLVLRREIYATACILGGLVNLAMVEMGLGVELRIPAVIVTVTGIRIIAILFGLSLPRLRPPA